MVQSVEERRASTRRWKKDNPKKLWVQYAIGRAKRRAKKKNLPFNLTTEHIHSIITDECVVFGNTFAFAGNVTCSDNSPSIDRIDPKKGYVIGNVVIISLKANNIKNAYTSDDLMKVALWLKSIEDDKT